MNTTKQTMDIKLLEQLKKAGLPQEGGIMVSQGTRIMHTSDHCYCPRCTGEEYVKEPLLEELIDWCEPLFLALMIRERKNEGVVAWKALSVGTALGVKEEYYGKTRKEAVAKLGLALHKKV